MRSRVVSASVTRPWPPTAGSSRKRSADTGWSTRACTSRRNVSSPAQASIRKAARSADACAIVS
jgi:hypothetical protein